MKLSLFRIMQKTEKQITPTNPPCVNQALGQYDKRLLYETEPQGFRKTYL